LKNRLTTKLSSDPGLLVAVCDRSGAARRILRLRRRNKAHEHIQAALVEVRRVVGRRLELTLLIDAIGEANTAAASAFAGKVDLLG
jgi:hypothetical protein